jgi:NitT/TauT family transport system substrate-binding protein
MKRKNRSLWRLPLIMLLIGAFAIQWAACGKTSLIRVRLCEVTHSIFYTPLYAALNQGFFEQEGLEIELSNGNGADKVMTALLSGQADIGFMGPESTLYVYNEGRDDYVVNFAQLTQTDGSFLVGRVPEPDFSWERVRGKTIVGGRIGGMPEMTLEYVLKQKGIQPGADVEVLTNIQFALMAGAFTGGTGDYVALFEPVASQVELEGSGHVVASIGKEAGNVPYTVFNARKGYIEQNQDIIQRFTNAVHRGQLWVQSNTPEAIVKAIKPAFPDTSDDILASAVKRYQEQDSWAKTPNFTDESFARLQDIMTLAGQLDQRAPYDKLVTNTYADQAVANVKG